MVSHLKQDNGATAATRQQRIAKALAFHLSALTIFCILCLVSLPARAECKFIVPNSTGEAVIGPSLDRLPDGFTRGALDCGREVHRLMIITIDVDTTAPHIGVRDDPLFKMDVTGPLEPLGNIAVTDTTDLHVLGRLNASPRIGVRRGFVRFATMCDRTWSSQPLNCSWGDSRIKFRSTTLDTNNDEVFDRSYHELSVYQSAGRLHMVTFWTPYRGPIENISADWMNALKAVGLKISPNHG